MSAFSYTFPAIRGIQATREFFVSMCPLKLIPKIFLFDEDELTPDLRAQRTLNRTRIPEMSRYLIQNRKDYVFSAITASVSGKTKFNTTDNEKFENASCKKGLIGLPLLTHENMKSIGIDSTLL